MRTRLSRRRFLLAVLPALAACNAVPTVPVPQVLNGPVAQIALPKQVNLVVPVPDKLWADRLAGRTRDYQDQNPNVTVELRPITGMPRGPFDVDKWVDLLEALASGQWIDAVVGWDVWAPDLIDRGILRSLDPYLVDIGRPIENYFMAASVQAFRRFGRVWMLPWQAQPAVLFYNKQLFDDATIPVGARRWTWQDVETYGALLTKQGEKSQVWGFDLGTGPEPLIYQNGGRIVDDPVEPTRPTLDEPPNVAALSWVDDLIRKSRIMPSAGDFRGYGEARASAFGAGQIAMRLDVMGARGGTNIGSTKPWSIRWGVMAPPTRVTSATTANFQSWGILQSSQQVDEAWRLVRHLCTRLPAEARIDGIPAFLQLQGSPDLSRLVPEGTEAYMKALSETVPTPATSAANAIANALVGALFQVGAGQALPADALRSAQQAASLAWTKQPAPKPAPAPIDR